MIRPARNGCLVGYARVSTDDQDLTLQIDSLVGLGVKRDDIFTDKISGAKTSAPAWMPASPACSKAIRLSSGVSIGLAAACTP